jgi:hypothetical protein
LLTTVRNSHSLGPRGSPRGPPIFGRRFRFF